MACFLVPVSQAIVATVAAEVLESKDKKNLNQKTKGRNKVFDSGMGAIIPFSIKLKWLSNLLWGGSFLLAFEHVWHGEVVPWFPFLTAAGNPEDAAIMLHEMSTVGVSMVIVVTAVWIGMVLISNAMENKELKTRTITRSGGVL